MISSYFRDNLCGICEVVTALAGVMNTLISSHSAFCQWGPTRRGEQQDDPPPPHHHPTLLPLTVSPLWSLKISLQRAVRGKQDMHSTMSHERTCSCKSMKDDVSVHWIVWYANCFSMQSWQLRCTSTSKAQVNIAPVPIVRHPIGQTYGNC